MKEIMALYYEINNIYLELYKLELSGNKDSADFFELVSLLKEKIMDEKELFDKMKGTYDCSKIDVSKLDSPYAKRFADYATFSYDTGIDIEDENTKEKVDVSNYAKIYKACSQNLFLIYLSYLQELLDMDYYSSLRDKLLNYKYFNSFLFHDVESVLIDNNFNISRIIF